MLDFVIGMSFKGCPLTGTRPSSLSVPSSLLSGSLSLSSDALPWVLRRFGASWSESDILRCLVEGIFPRMVPLWVVGRAECVGGMLKAMVDDGDDGGWR